MNSHNISLLRYSLFLKSEKIDNDDVFENTVIFPDFEKKDLEFISNHVFNFFVKDPSNENDDFKTLMSHAGGLTDNLLHDGTYYKSIKDQIQDLSLNKYFQVY